MNMHGQKYTNLQKLQAAHLRVPRFVAISVHADVDDAYHQAQQLGFPLIMRSSFGVEDDASQSNQGIFESVVCDDLASFHACYKEIVARNLKTLARVCATENIDQSQVVREHILQQYIAPLMAGVMMVPIDQGSAVEIEYSDMVDGVTSGTVDPLCIRLDAHTHKLDEPFHELYAVAQKIREIYDVSQELEWLTDARGELYILQSRPYKQLISEDQIIADEITRLHALGLSAKQYDDSFLPAIDEPTPLTVSIVNEMYAHAFGKLGYALTQNDIVVTIFGYPYVDNSRYIKKTAWLAGYGHMLTAIRAHRQGAFVVPENVDNLSLPDLLHVLTNDLAPQSVRASMILQTLRSNVCKMARVSRDHAAFDAPETQFSRDLRARTIEELRAKYWYLSDNEYELSSPRMAERAPGALDFLFAPRSDEGAQLKLLSDLSSAFDRAIVSRLLLLYNEQFAYKDGLHQRMIQAVARIRYELLRIDKKYTLGNLIWYCSLEEILQDKLPDARVLADRKQRVTCLQRIPLRNIATIVAWEELVDTTTDGNTTWELEPLCAGSAYGVVGQDIMVRADLNYALLDNPHIKAIICEKGGTLSHLALYARQRNIPVYRLPGARSYLKDGVYIRIVDNRVVLG